MTLDELANSLLESNKNISDAIDSIENSKIKEEVKIVASLLGNQIRAEFIRYNMKVLEFLKEASE